MLDALVAVPGASLCLRGGVVAYAADVKHAVLGVPTDLLARHGTVHPEVALAMAAGVRELLGADLGLATTGVAGPAQVDGHLPGEAFVALVGARGERVVAEPADPTGGRAGIRGHVRDVAMDLLLRHAGDLVR